MTVQIEKNYIDVYIPGIPLQKQRHRFSRKTGHAYDPNRDNEALVVGRMGIPEDFIPWTGPVVVLKMDFVFPRPKSHYRSGSKSHLLKDSAPPYAESVLKDIDNLEKFYLDALNCLVYVDDKQIVQVVEKNKRWCFEEGEVPHVFISMRRL